jgi:hypothetical protein
MLTLIYLNRYILIDAYRLIPQYVPTVEICRYILKTSNFIGPNVYIYILIPKQHYHGNTYIHTFLVYFPKVKVGQSNH